MSAALLDFVGRRVVVTGAANGIGAATLELLVECGAEVHAVDLEPVSGAAACHRADLGSSGSIETLLAVLPPSVDVLFNCAGIPNGGRFTPAEIMAVNWFGLRQLTEGLLPRMPGGSSVVHVASTAGRNWADHRAELQELTTADSAAGSQWVQDHPDLVGDGYALSKEAVQYYTMWRALEVVNDGIRMNSICPGVTNTRLAQDFRTGVGDDVVDRALGVAGRLAEPVEMAPALIFLADEFCASYINGVNLNVDRGTGAAHALGQW